MENVTDKLLKFIRENRILNVTAIWAAVLFGAQVLNGLFAGNILSRFTRNDNVLLGILFFPVGLAISFGVYVLITYLISVIMQGNTKVMQKRNTLKALLVYGMGDAVIGVLGSLLTLVFIGSTTRAGLYGGLSMSVGIMLLISLAWVVVFTNVIAKIYNVSWLKGCAGLIISAVVFAVVITILGLIGLGGILSFSGLTGLAG